VPFFLLVAAVARKEGVVDDMARHWSTRARAAAPDLVGQGDDGGSAAGCDSEAGDIGGDLLDLLALFAQKYKY
jgi:hypothetical protein